MRAHDQLMEQNVALDLARREAEKAIHARNDFLAVMNHEMRTPMHAIIALSSLLLETELTPERRVMIETILKSSNLLATLINGVLDLSRLEDGSLELEIGKFNLHGIFREVIIPVVQYSQMELKIILICCIIYLYDAICLKFVGHEFDKACRMCEEVIHDFASGLRSTYMCCW